METAVNLDKEDAYTVHLLGKIAGVVVRLEKSVAGCLLLVTNIITPFRCGTL